MAKYGHDDDDDDYEYDDYDSDDDGDDFTEHRHHLWLNEFLINNMGGIVETSTNSQEDHGHLQRVSLQSFLSHIIPETTNVNLIKSWFLYQVN